MADGGELAAAFRALAEDAAQAGKDIGNSMGKWFEDTADIEEENVNRTLAADAENTRALNAIRPNADVAALENGAGGATGSSGGSGISRALSGDDSGATGELAGSGEGSGSGLSDASGPSGSRSTGEMDTAGDPVDVATGDVVLSQADVTLPGLLPLVLQRTHRSSHRTGRWLGKSWLSSFDQRLEVYPDRVLGAFADGRVLTWPRPDAGNAAERGAETGGRMTANNSQGSDAGEGALPEHGPAWPLRRDGDAWVVTDRQRGLAWRFEPRDGYWSSGLGGGQGELPLVSVSDRAGHEIRFEYKPDGVPAAAAHSGGYRVDVAVSEGRITGLEFAGVTLVCYDYDEDENLTGVVNSSGEPLRFTYDPDGRLTGWTDRNRHSYRYRYDDLGRCVRGESPSGALSGIFDYEQPYVTRWTDGAGAVTEYRRDDPFRIIGVIDPLGHESRTDHDRRGRVIAETDPLGRVTRYGYDRAGNLVSVTRPDGGVARAEYDENCLPVAVTDADGAGWRQSFDELGNRTALTAPDGTVTRCAYDQRGHLASVTGPDGAVTSVVCDAAGLPVAVTAPDGAVTRYERDQFGRVGRVVDPAGGVTLLTWTVEGLPVSRTRPDGSVETWTWDGEGNLLRHVSPGGAVTGYEYGPFDKPVAVAWPDGTRSSFGYDREQRLTAVTHGGLTWSYAYDPAGRLVEETDYNGAVTSYLRDAAGQLARRVNAAGQSVAYRYDPLGNVVAEEGPGGVTTFGYDEAGRLVRARSADADVVIERDALGRVIAETSNGRTVSVTYDAGGRLTGRVTPSGTSTSWTYDAAGLPAAMAAGGQELRFGYDAAGREVSRGLPGGVTLAQEWDPIGRLVSQALFGRAAAPRPEGPATPGQPLQRRSYSYNPDGFVTGIEDALTGARGFGLDPSGRVTSVTGPEWAERYAYDPAGNVASAMWPAVRAERGGGWLDAGPQGAREVSGTLVAAAGNVRYRHDAAGRVVTRTRVRLSRKPETWRYEWDADNRLVSVATPDGSVWRYSYDPLGRRIGKRHVSASGEVVSETRFAWDGAVLAEQSAWSSAERPGAGEEVTTWDYQPGSFAPVAQSSHVVGAADAPQDEIDRRFYAIVTDLTGTPSELIAADGSVAGYQQHTLWGGTVWHPSGASTPLRFPGQYADAETGLHYNNQRYYDPVTGAYLTPDPLGLGPAPNHHAYVRNPVVQTDHLGLLRPCVQQALKEWRSQRFQFDDQQFLLDKNDMNHIMTRHMPEFWDGSIKTGQTFFHEDMSIQDVQDRIKSVLQQNRETLINHGTNAIYQIHGTFDGRAYTLGVRYGHIHQFFPR